MPILFFILLGLIQGLTEFLPVSSSGHLAVAQNFFGFAHKNDLLVEILAHFGSLASIVYFYRKDFLRLLSFDQVKQNSTKITPLLLSILPAGLVGFLFQEKMVPLFTNMKIVAFGFLITSGLLISLRYLQNRVQEKSLEDWPTNKKALVIGFFQAFALFPGISRSGSTIVSGIWLGLKPKQAAYFSFCSVLPLIAGASLSLVFKIIANPAEISLSAFEMLVLLLSSFFFGWVGLIIVDKFLEKDKFFYFSFYLVPLALFLLMQ